MNSSVQLSICGDVERPVRLTLAELRSVMDAEVVADFHCREGWSRLGERWRGVRLRTLLALAGAADAAGYVTVGCGDYTAVLTRGQAEDERVLLALEHEGAPSPREAGFPRLVGPSDWDCFLGVKSVDRIEVTRQPQQATAATIALARLERLGVCHPSLNGGDARLAVRADGRDPRIDPAGRPGRQPIADISARQILVPDFDKPAASAGTRKPPAPTRRRQPLPAPARGPGALR